MTQPSPHHATLITAFYPIKSKFPPTQYLEWTSQFMHLKAPIVLFTTPELVEVFAGMRGPTTGPLHIIPRPFEELATWTLYSQQWIVHHDYDIEKDTISHTPELYALWAQKAFFVEEVTALNPFGTSHFFWCDIGAFRNPTTHSRILDTFPASQHLPQDDRILLCSVAGLKLPADGERRRDRIVGDFGTHDRIVGGLWGGTAAACRRWKAAYEAQLIKYFAAGRFAGKDQSVMLSAFLENPRGLAIIVEPPMNRLGGARWFFLQELLTEPALAPFVSDPTYLAAPVPTRRIHLTVMGGLANQMFQVAAAYAAARRTGAQLVLAAQKERDDGRPLYWQTVLHRFQHFISSVATTPTPTWWEPAPTVYAQPPPPPANGDLRIAGYFQSSKYFADCATEMRLLMRPDAPTLAAIKRDQTYADLLEARDRVVIVHARRTDYLKHADHHGPLTAAYYKAATAAIHARIADPIFLLVSDDPMYWMEIMSEVPAFQTATFQILMENDEIRTLALLQQFKWFIIANSTFSWWAAWLSDAPPENVYAPARWFGPTGPANYEDIYEPSWNRITCT
jgi:hypothetical protein